MINGKISSYEGFINSKKVYLKRKKKLNKEIKNIRKKRKKCKGEFLRKYYLNKINKGKDDIFILRIMYNLKKEKILFIHNSNIKYLKTIKTNKMEDLLWR